MRMNGKGLIQDGERERKNDKSWIFFLPTGDPYVTKTFQLCCDDGDKDAGLQQKVKKVIISINFGRDLIENEWQKIV